MLFIYWVGFQAYIPLSNLDWDINFFYQFFIFLLCVAAVGDSSATFEYQTVWRLLYETNHYACVDVFAVKDAHNTCIKSTLIIFYVFDDG